MSLIQDKIKKEPVGLVARAHDFAKRAHQGQKRKTGEPYFNHCLKAAEYVAEWKLDDTSVAAALLHDVVEDTDATPNDVKDNFGEEVAFLVDGVTKLGRIKYRGVEAQVENLRKMFLALSRDIRVVIVKLADRLHNMTTLKALPPQKQRRIAVETSELYAPLAYRLGMQKVSGELEDLAFPFIYSQEHDWLEKNVKEKYGEREKYLERVKPVILEALKKQGIVPFFVDSRAKRYSSLYKKLLRYNMDVNNIYDLMALRIAVKNVEECYATLGVVHNLWPPLPGRIKDYIALPKPNGYRSLHTTVFCLDNKITEIQIRTPEMHNEAENGIAAHWAYTQTRGSKQYLNKRPVFADKKELVWIGQLRAWQRDFSDPDEFMDSLKIDFFKDRIFAITPKGEVIDLPLGATPVDFAYHVHSEIGDCCSGARVNGKIMPLDHVLSSGDIVDIIVQKNKKPSESWLTFAKTGMAKHKIRAALKNRTSAVAKENEQLELRIVAEDRIGLLKDIAAIISRSHINIVGLNTKVDKSRGGRFTVVKINCEAKNRGKAKELLVKLKRLKEIKEIDHRFLTRI